MAAPYGNFDFYRNAQSRANKIQNRDTQQQQNNPLRDSLMGTPMQQLEPTDEQPSPPTQPDGMQYTMKPYAKGGGMGNRGAAGNVVNTQRERMGGGLDMVPGLPRPQANGGIDEELREKFRAAVRGAPPPGFGGEEPEQGAPQNQALLDSILPQNAASSGGQDSSLWNTEGWATPSYLGKAAGGAMSGWDQTNWDDPNMQTPKYVVGRILSNYQPSIEGLGQAMQEIQQAYPGAEFDGKDKIIIPGLGTIDVLVNAGGENTSWAWQDLTNSPGTDPALSASLMKGSTATDPTSALLGGLDPSLLSDPTWRQLLAGLGIKL